MATKDCINYLVQNVGGDKLSWKRRSKARVLNGTLRSFENIEDGTQVYYLSDIDRDGDGSILPYGQLYYRIWQDGDKNILTIVPESRRLKEDWQQPISRWLTALYGLINLGKETRDNKIEIVNIEFIERTLETAGLIKQ